MINQMKNLLSLVILLLSMKDADDIWLWKFFFFSHLNPEVIAFYFNWQKRNSVCFKKGIQVVSKSR